MRYNLLQRFLVQGGVLNPQTAKQTRDIGAAAGHENGFPVPENERQTAGPDACDSDVKRFGERHNKLYDFYVSIILRTRDLML